MQLALVPRSTKAVTAIPNTKCLVADASDLGLPPGHVWEQLYDDACDVGIALKSHKSDKVTHWYLSDGDQNKSWLLKPTTETVRKLPNLQDWVLRIVND